jgi:predicted peptidase
MSKIPSFRSIHLVSGLGAGLLGALVMFSSFGSLTFADEPAPGTQVAVTISVPANQNEFRTGRGIELTSEPLDEDQTEELQFWLYLPKDYDDDAEEGAPLMLFLHGAGERGDNIDKVKFHGPPKLCLQQEDWPFVTVSPQCPTGRWWNTDQLGILLDKIVETYNIDEDRIYVTGLSMGGYGTWALTAQTPERFAAAAPICGGGEPEKADQLVDLPIWAFHGGADGVVPPERSEAMVDAIKAAGGEKIKLTIYPGVGHNSWTETYANPDLYEWMLSLKRKSE